MTTEYTILELLAFLIGLILIVEGFMPFFFPKIFRSIMARVIERDDALLQRIGGFSIICGCAFVLLAAL